MQLGEVFIQANENDYFATTEATVSNQKWV